jgi:hypothetical protein
MNLVDRAKNIMFNPRQEWGVVKSESIATQDMYLKYAVILAAIPAVAGLIGFSMVGISWGFGTIKIPFGTALTWAITHYIISLAGVFILSFIVDVLAPSFGSAKDINASTKVVVFAYTPAWVAGIFYIIPSLTIIAALAGIYALVLMYMGLQNVKDVPQDKMAVYFIVVIILAIVVFWATGAITTSVSFGDYRMSGL